MEEEKFTPDESGRESDSARKGKQKKATWGLAKAALLSGSLLLAHDEVPRRINNHNEGVAGDPIEKQIVKTPVIYQEIHLPGYQDSSGQISIDTSFVAYFGENMYRLNEISRLSEKLSEAAKAISALEKEFEENAVDTLGIADSGEDNAFVVVGRKNIMFFNMEHIATHGPEGVAETAEH